MIFDRTAPNRKPAFGSVQINRAHSLGQTLGGLCLFNEGGGNPVDLVKGGSTPVTTPGPWKTGRNGSQADFTSGYYLENTAISAETSRPNTTGLTVVWRGQAVSAGSIFSNGVMQYGVGGGWAVKLLSDTTMRITKIAVIDVDITITGGNGDLYAMWALVDTRAGSNNLIVYRNGVSIGTATETSNYGLSATPQLRIGAENNGTTWGRTLDYWAFWFSPLSAPQIAGLVNEPYSFLTPKAPRLWMLGKPSVSAVFRRLSSLVGTRVGSRQIGS